MRGGEDRDRSGKKHRRTGHFISTRKKASSSKKVEFVKFQRTLAREIQEMRERIEEKGRIYNNVEYTRMPDLRLQDVKPNKAIGK